MTQDTAPAPDPARHGPWAVVAGGSEGVGAEMALQLAAAGIATVLVARRLEPLAETAERVRALGVECRTVAVDLTDPGAVDAVATAAEGLDVGLLVYNAGANTYGAPFAESDPERVQQVIDLNVTAPMALIRRFAPGLVARGRGGVLVVGSMAGYLGHADMSVYSAAKAFSRVFVEGLWLELREHGVDVCEAVLGVTRTPAMVRAGLDLDLPGMTVAEPADAAREALAALDHGPVVVCGGEANIAGVAHSSGTDRGRIVAGAAKRMKALRGS